MSDFLWKLCERNYGTRLDVHLTATSEPPLSVIAEVPLQLRLRSDLAGLQDLMIELLRQLAREFGRRDEWTWVEKIEYEGAQIARRLQDLLTAPRDVFIAWSGANDRETLRMPRPENPIFRDPHWSQYILDRGPALPPSDTGLEGAIPLPPLTPLESVDEAHWAEQNRKINDLLMRGDR